MEVWLVNPRALLISDWGSVIGVCGLMIVSLGSAKAGKLLRKPGFKFFGNISYSVYLNHIPMLYLTIFLLHDYLPLLLILPVYIALVIMFSFVTWRLIERPAIALGRFLSNRQRKLLRRT